MNQEVTPQPTEQIIELLKDLSPKERLKILSDVSVGLDSDLLNDGNVLVLSTHGMYMVSEEHVGRHQQYRVTLRQKIRGWAAERLSRR